MSSYPTGRDALARHLYVVEPHGPEVGLTAAEQAAGAREWDSRQVTARDRADCYQRADRILAEAAR
ncbi:hypothetical protein [Actinoplanes sp. URMC 104]|uniref:hypothetical protein n=1 Tax=Actinoplanes sp. URMC 104 TaxID=3423409 RepID=UPI003F1954D7